MIHSLLFGLLLGYGAAIPLGPMNLEIIRRNLVLGPRFGVAFGLGACSVDLVYLTILSLGMINALTHTVLLKIVTLLGSCIIGWFALNAFRAKNTQSSSGIATPQKIKHPIAHYSQGFIMTLINPITILFWASVSSQITGLIHQQHGSILLAGMGVLLGTVSWVIFINTTLKLTRHKFSDTAMLWINRIGGIILAGFAFAGIAHFFLI